jgi:hypothetical protein
MWVFLTNSSAIYYLYLGTRSITSLNRLLDQSAKNEAEWMHFALWAFLPSLGIILEALRSGFAKWLNIGYWLFYGLYFCLVFVWNRSDYHAAPFLLFAPVALAIASVNCFSIEDHQSRGLICHPEERVLRRRMSIFAS